MSGHDESILILIMSRQSITPVLIKSSVRRRSTGVRLAAGSSGIRWKIKQIPLFIQIVLWLQVISMADVFVLSVNMDSMVTDDEENVNARETNNLIDNAENNSEDDKDYFNLDDGVEDGFFDPFSPDPSCSSHALDDIDGECWSPPQSTIVTDELVRDTGNCDHASSVDCNEESKTIQAKGKDGEKRNTITVDKHWGSDETILKMRDELRNAGNGASLHTNEEESNEERKKDPHHNRRPPVFLMPGLASTRLVSWKYKSCSNPLLSDVKVQDYVWMNINMLLQMKTIDEQCFFECMTLGLNQTDMNDIDVGCKLRPDEGLDAISSLAPGSFGSNLLVGGKNTVYAWLTQWLADNLGYDVSSMIGLPFDWRLSPDIMEKRDGFLTLTRRRIEAAVASNGAPGIMVAHSMGNNVFRYFLEWLRNEMHEEAYVRYVQQAKQRERKIRAQHKNDEGIGQSFVQLSLLGWTASLPGWMGGQPHSDYDFLAVEPAVEDEQIYDVTHSLNNEYDNLFSEHFPENKEEKLSASTSEHPDSGEKESSGSSTHRGKYSKLWELAKIEGDTSWLEWINAHIWTYVGLSAPLLGAANPLRAVISGENMGMPMTEESARKMELSFGSTHTINPISTRTGFCDDDFGPINDASKRTSDAIKNGTNRANLACLDELVKGITGAGRGKGKDPWRDFPALKSILEERVDWDTDFSPIAIHEETCVGAEKSPCKLQEEKHFGPKDIQTGNIFSEFSKIWKEKGNPLKIKLEQLESSWWNNPFPNLLDSTWDRPHIKHIIMAYGIDYPTEVGYVYRKSNKEESKSQNAERDGATPDQVVETEVNDYDDKPLLQTVIWEEPTGVIIEESKIPEPKSLTESVMLKKKKSNKRFLNNGDGQGKLHHSGDGSVPYLSLAWAHTWLLHATRAMRHSRFDRKEGERISDDNALESIVVSYRPKGGSEWLEGGKRLIEENASIERKKSNQDSDTGARNPHGTKYKPEMFRFQSKGKSRSTGMEYTTAVIEAMGIEHKETTRNYDILAAVFSDVLKHMHDDLGLV